MKLRGAAAAMRATARRLIRPGPGEHRRRAAHQRLVDHRAVTGSFSAQQGGEDRRPGEKGRADEEDHDSDVHPQPGAHHRFLRSCSSSSRSRGVIALWVLGRASVMRARPSSTS